MLKRLKEIQENIEKGIIKKEYGKELQEMYFYAKEHGDKELKEQVMNVIKKLMKVIPPKVVKLEEGQSVKLENGITIERKRDRIVIGIENDGISS